MQLLANGKQQFIDASGAPLASGKVYFYAPGTLTPSTTYQDAAGAIPNTNPVNLDSLGQAVIWGTGSYRQIVKDVTGNQIWDQIVATPDLNAPTASFAGAAGSALIGFQNAGTGSVARTAQDKLRESISVKDFGAKGDGATDDTATIQAAINSLTSGGALYFPPGNYKITATLNAPAGVNNVTLYGAGNASKIFSTTNYISLILISQVSGWVVEKLYLLGPGNGRQIANQYGSGVIFDRSTACQVRFCRIEKCGNWDGVGSGVGGVWDSNSIDCTVSNNLIINCNNGYNQDGFLGGVIANQPRGGLVIGNQFITNRAHALTENGTVAVGAGPLPPGAATIMGNYFEGHSAESITAGLERYGIKMFSSAGTVTMGNRLQGCYDGIIVSTNDQNGVVSGNEVSGSSRYGIWVHDENAQGDVPTGTSVTGNVVFGSANHGIYSQAGDAIQISGNRVISSTGDGINVSSGHTSVTSNHITGAAIAGVNINGATGSVQVSGNYLLGKGTATGTADGISINAASAVVHVGENVICNDSAANGFRYGVNIAAGVTTLGINKITNMVTAALNTGTSGTPAIPYANLSNPLNLTTQTITGAASTGPGTALPPNPYGYLTVNVNGTAFKLPIYNL